MIIDMLLGMDFFLSHHIYISKAQHRLYFTYNGGLAQPGFPPGCAGGAGAVASTSAQPAAAPARAAYRRRVCGARSSAAGTARVFGRDC